MAGRFKAGDPVVYRSSIQIRDLSGGIHSFQKADLKELQRDTGKSPMPSFRGTLSASEVDDLVAYLVSLRGNQ